MNSTSSNVHQNNETCDANSEWNSSFHTVQLDFSTIDLDCEHASSSPQRCNMHSPTSPMSRTSTTPLQCFQCKGTLHACECGALYCALCSKIDQCIQCCAEKYPGACPCPCAIRGTRCVIS